MFNSHVRFACNNNFFYRKFEPLTKSTCPLHTSTFFLKAEMVLDVHISGCSRGINSKEIMPSPPTFFRTFQQYNCKKQRLHCGRAHCGKTNGFLQYLAGLSFDSFFTFFHVTCSLMHLKSTVSETMFFDVYFLYKKLLCLHAFHLYKHS